MHRIPPSRLVFACGFMMALILTFIGGCQREMVRQYPCFYEPSIRVVAVVPFCNESSRPGVGEIYADRLSSALEGNGTYKILRPCRLNECIPPCQRICIKDCNSIEIAARMHEAANPCIDAFLTGTVRVLLDYDPWRNNWTRYSCGESLYGYYDGSEVIGYGESYDPVTYPPYKLGFRYFAWGYPPSNYEFATAAKVYVEAKIVRVSDGKVLHTAKVQEQSVVCMDTLWPKRVLLEAMDKTVQDLVEEFAITLVEKPYDCSAPCPPRQPCVRTEVIRCSEDSLPPCRQ